MSSLPIKGCIFDMDGLLIDSESVYSEIINEILKRYGKPELSKEAKSRMMGRPLADAHAELVDAMKVPELTLEEYRKILTDTQKFKNVPPMKGAIELLETLKSKGIPVAVATSSRRNTFNKKVENLHSLFKHFEECVVTSDDLEGQPGKPAPFIFTKALKELNAHYKTNLEPKDVCVFEDSLQGIQAAISANMKCCAVPDDRYNLERNLIEETINKEVGNGLVCNSLDEFLNDNTKFHLESPL